MKKKSIQPVLQCWIFINLMALVPTAHAAFCEYSQLKIENQSTQALKIARWEATLYSQMTVSQAPAEPQVLRPGASITFEVSKLSYLIYDTGGIVRVQYEVTEKKKNVELAFLFHAVLFSCIPKDVTYNKGSIAY